MLLLLKTPPLTYPNMKRFEGPKMDYVPQAVRHAVRHALKCTMKATSLGFGFAAGQIAHRGHAVRRTVRHAVRHALKCTNRCGRSR